MARDLGAGARSEGSDPTRSRRTTGESSGPSSFGDLSRYALVPPPAAARAASADHRPHTAPDTAHLARLEDHHDPNRRATEPSFHGPARLSQRPTTSQIHMPPPMQHDPWPNSSGDRRYDPPMSTQPLISPASISPYHTRPTTGSSATAGSEGVRGRFMSAAPIPTRPPAARSTATAPHVVHIAGYQPDYSRAGHHLRAPSAPSLGSHGGGVPLESLMMVRIGHTPTHGARDIRGPTEKWIWSLDILQAPVVGKALEFEDLTPDFPRLIPPLVVRLDVKDENNVRIAASNDILQGIVTHLVTQLFLQSHPTGSPRDLIHRRARSLSVATPGEAIVYPTMPGALRSTTAQLLELDGQLEWLFLFPDLVVRPRGEFQLEAVLLNVRAPGPAGTSTGITHILARAVTEPFDNLPAVAYASSHLATSPPTALSSTLAEQGAEGLTEPREAE